MPLCSPALLVLLVGFAGIGCAVHAATTFTLVNQCSYPVWPGVLPATLGNGGFVLLPDQAQVLSAPSGWSGRFWPRTGCNFTAAESGTCLTGDCGGKLECEGTGGAPPATLAEFTLGGKDFYDVSLVDGYNVPLVVAPVGGSGANCSPAGCASGMLNTPACPSQLQVESEGRIVACRSACEALNEPQYCCTGAFGSAQTCFPTAYSRIFKAVCPTAYSYAFDDPTSTFTCIGASGYTITFCPTNKAMAMGSMREQVISPASVPLAADPWP